MQTSRRDQQLRNSPASQLDQKNSTIRAEMTLVITTLLAAGLISRSDFPNKSVLPRTHPFAFNNFGHQLLMDYELLLRIVWEVIEEIKSSIEKWDGKKRPWIIGAAITGIGLLGLAVAAKIPMLIVPALLVPVILHNIGRKKIHKSMEKDIADIRANAIKVLMKGEWKSTNEGARKTITAGSAKGSSKVGGGELGGEKVAVITIVDDKEPFTGYGRLQAENLFICRPKEKTPEPVPTIEDIYKAISRNVTEEVLGLDIRETSFGEVVVVHGDSLSKDSKWLDEDKAPVLYTNESELENVQSIDPRASTRTYFAIQILFPQYMTVATFFVRLFWAGNAASCQIAVTTLGPPSVSPEYLQMRLLKHERELEEDEQPFKHASLTQEEMKAVDYLRRVRIWGQDNTPFQRDLNYQELKELDATWEIESRGHSYDEEYKKIIKESAMWPGSYYKLHTNWRENNSLTFTTDFFGRPEAIASVRALYDQISRSMLDTLDTLGFDISDFRDKEGKYSINAEKIDQLVVGERIHFDKSAEAKKPEPAATQAKGQVA